MKKILILANNSIGLYNFRFELVEHLIKKGYEVYFSLPESIDDEKVKLLIMAGAKHIETKINRRGINPYKEFQLLYNYRKLISKIKPDLIITYTIKPNIYGTYLAGIKNIPSLMNITGLGTAFTKPIIKDLIIHLYKYTCRMAKIVFFENESNRKFFLDNRIVDINKTVLLPGSGVNTFKFKPLKKEKLNDRIKFLFIGRIMKEKGINEYLNVANNITSKYNNVEFYVMGFFEEKEYEKVFNMNENNRIRYLGFSSDVRNEIAAVDCIVNPSYHEGMSNVLLEAAAMGKPLIASNIPGCKEIVSDGENGFLFDVQSSKSLEEKIIKFINLNEETKVQMGEASREIAVRKFDRNIVIEKYLEVIEDII